MDIQRFLDRHPSITSCHEVKQLCQPLNLLGINYFSFVRIYTNHQRVSFCTHEQWQHLFYQRFLNEEYQRQYVTFERMAKDNDITVLSTYPDNEAFIDACTHFKLYDGIVIRERLKNYTEIAYFGAEGEASSVVHFCLSNIDLLKRFVAYFKEMASKMILQQESNKIIPPEIYVAKEKQILTLENQFSDEKIQEFLNSTKTKRYRISSSDNEEYLTLKEQECLNWTALGKSAEETAMILDISPRTVEVHLDNIKAKMQCHKLTRLVYDAVSQGIIMRGKPLHHSMRDA